MDKFTKTFLGNVKYLMNNKDGMTTTKEMSKILNVDEEFVLVFCELMTIKGYIQYTKAEKKLIFQKGNGKKKENIRLEEMVKRYLLDKQSYIKYSLQKYEK